MRTGQAPSPPQQPPQARQLGDPWGARGPAGTAIVAVLVAGVLAMGAVAALSWQATIVVLACAAFAFLFVLPVWLLPSLAFAAFALLPVGYLSGVPEVVGRFLSPTVLVLAVYGLRSWRDRDPGPTRTYPYLLGIGLLLLVPFSINPARSLLWVVVLGVAALLPSTLTTGFRTTEALRRTWFVIAGLLALYAIAESVTHLNPLGGLYTVEQHWSVYRVTTTIGHPLLNGAFFATTACLAVFAALQGGRARWLPMLVFPLSGVAAALTGSRSALVALAAGLAVGLIVSIFSRRLTARVKVGGLTLAVATVLTLPNLPTFADRLGSLEAAASASYREAVVRLAVRLIEQQPLFGGGPGTSGRVAEQSGALLPLESGVLGTLVSVGLLGGAAIAVYLVLAWTAFARRQQFGALSALTAFLVAGGSFPLWESNAAALALVGLVWLAGGTSSAASSTTQPTARLVAPGQVVGARTSTAPRAASRSAADADQGQQCVGG